MPKLVLIHESGASAEYELKPGLNRVGRDPGNDLIIEHDSVSDLHCEVYLSSAGVRVLHRGNVNGTWIEGEPVEEAMLGVGQTLQLGEVQFQLQAPPPAQVRVVSPTRSWEQPVSTAGVDSFWQGITTAFRYPFRGNGGALLLAGTVALAATDYAAMMARAAPVYGLIALLILTVGVCGYLFAFIKDVLATSAQGETHLPGWPEVESPSDFVGPFLQFLALLLACFGPAFLWSRWGPEVGVAYVTLALGFLGAFCLPMALVGIALADSVAGLNPLLVVTSILRIFGHYLVAFGLLLSLLAVDFGGNWLAAVLPVPVLPTLLKEFATLYLAVVTARVLGVMYYVNRDTLGWFR